MLTPHAQEDRKALPESPALTVLLANPEAADYLACLATMRQSNCTLMDNAFGAHLDHLVPLAHLDPLDPLDPKEALVLLAALAKMVAVDHLDPPDPPALLAQMANPDLLEALAPTPLPAAKATLDPKEALESLVPVVPMAIVVPQENQAQLDPLDHKDPHQALARTETKDPLARLAPRVALDRTPNTVLAPTAPRNIKHPYVHWIRRGSIDFPLDSLVKCFLFFFVRLRKGLICRRDCSLV